VRSFSRGAANLTGNDAIGQSLQGSAVALSANGTTAVVGGSGDLNLGAFAGSTWVCTRAGASWVQQGPKLVGSGAVGPYEGQGSFGDAIGGRKTVLVGAPGDGDHTGAAWEFTRSGRAWRQQGGKLVGTGATGQAQQGSSEAFSADGNTAIVGGP
jgi:hypothetical protein